MLLSRTARSAPGSNPQKVGDGTMPPAAMPRPTAAERKQMVDWITQNIEAARVRVAPKNGLIRRLTVAQYRNTLQELLRMEDDLTNGIPPDAVSRDGFVNNQETLHLSTQLLESYLEIADTGAHARDDRSEDQTFDSGFPDGAGDGGESGAIRGTADAGRRTARCLNNTDMLMTEPPLTKPFAFDRHLMQTKYRYIEGYQGNDTVRGWRRIRQHLSRCICAICAAAADIRKGRRSAWFPKGMLLRPAIPNDEMFGADGTYGPKANFKISTRELPDDGRFRITVMAAKYDDGLLLDAGR